MNAAQFLSSELDFYLPIPEENFAGPSELLPAWNLVNRVKSSQNKSANKRTAGSVIPSAEDNTIPKKSGKKSKTKGQGPSSPHNTCSTTSVNQTGGKYSLYSRLL